MLQRPNVGTLKSENYLSCRTAGHYGSNPVNTGKALRVKRGLRVCLITAASVVTSSRPPAEDVNFYPSSPKEGKKKIMNKHTCQGGWSGCT